MPLLNDFKLGADPEFAIINDGHLTVFTGRQEQYVPWGIDHGGYVIEPHPKPELSVRTMIANIKTALNDFATVSPTGKWRAGAFFRGPERRITLGGHVHIDKQNLTALQQNGLDLFNDHLEKLDILPATECETRRMGGYGAKSDVRSEHGHCEYRTFPSWLYSQRVAKLCLIGSKLIVVDPEAPAETLGNVTKTSVAKLKAFFERFKGKDDDVDWILTGGLFARLKGINPDRDIRDVWKVEPKKETPHWKQAAFIGDRELPTIMRQTGPPPAIATPAGDAYPIFYTDDTPGGTIFEFRTANQIAPVDAFDIIIQIRSRPRIPGDLVFSRRGMGLTATIISNTGAAAWPEERITSTVIRTTIRGVRYRWKVASEQLRNDSLRETLRRLVLNEGYDHAVNLLVRDHFLILPLGPE